MRVVVEPGQAARCSFDHPPICVSRFGQRLSGRPSRKAWLLLYPYPSLCRRQQQTVALPSMAGRIYTVVMGSFGFGTSERITIMRLTSRLGRG